MSAKENNLEEKVKSLYEVMQQEKVEEIRIDSSDMKLHIRRKNYSRPVQRVAQSTANAPAKQEVSSPEPQQEVVLGESTIKSPITGVFYRSPSPTSPMFVKEGDVVETGKTLCIVEAMKVMNEIKATERAKIVKVLVENGEPINSQQDLFVIEKM
ncbi:acetyl-CoA carboxylase biotin carboxyl carrier protein [Candidatus Ruminimicrobiellum ovillum]|uniref:acetyl-CoA carboxylase biotin carboxyl carrier protein n=1 Tax=Candidatus Ruminimicrobiellum ovillum TaxID=1947927 RepID=UPI00355A7384